MFRKMKSNFIPSDAVYFLIILLSREMPRFAVAIHKCAALGPIPEGQWQRAVSLTSKHILESQSHYNLIVSFGLDAIVAIYDLRLSIVKKIMLIKKLQKITKDQLLKLKGKCAKLKITAKLTKENDQQQQSEINALIQKTEQRLALIEQQERELLELRDKEAARLFRDVDKLVAQHELQWQLRQEEAGSNLAKQLQRLYKITLTQEDLASLQDDASRFIAAKKATLEKNQIRIAKEATSYEILVHYVIWQWLSRSLKPTKEESAIFKSLLPYLKQEAELRKQLQEEIEQKYTALKSEVNNLQKIVDKIIIGGEDSSGKKSSPVPKNGDEQRASNHNSNSTSSFNFSILSCLVILAVCLIFAKACSTSVMG